MAKKPALSYENLTVGLNQPQPVHQQPEEPISAVEPSQRRQYMRDAAAPYTVYPHPAGAHALKLYALNERRKVHDLWMEAIEDWARKHGITAPFRVLTAEPRRSRS
jgi:hypothetical protein